MCFKCHISEGEDPNAYFLQMVETSRHKKISERDSINEDSSN